MRVKINNTFFDSEDYMILLVLSEEEKMLLQNMGEQTKFCVFPAECTIENVTDFMTKDQPSGNVNAVRLFQIEEAIKYVRAHESKMGDEDPQDVSIISNLLRIIRSIDK